MITDLILAQLEQPEPILDIRMEDTRNIFGRKVGEHEVRTPMGYESQTVELQLQTDEWPRLGKIGERFGCAVVLIQQSAETKFLGGTTYRATCAFYPIISLTNS